MSLKMFVHNSENILRTQHEMLTAFTYSLFFW